MAIKFQVKRSNNSTWSSVNPILAEGEFGFETNTNKLKIGNGSNTWNTLSYIATNAYGLSVCLENFHTSGGGTNATWHEALNAACSFLGANGGEITAYRDVTYTFTNYPSNIPANIVIRGRPNVTKFILPSAGGTLLNFAGSIANSYTTHGGSNPGLRANVEAGADFIQTGALLANNSWVQIKKLLTGASAGGYHTQILQVQSAANSNTFNTITFRTGLKFGMNTTDTLEINVLSVHENGGVIGIIFDGASCSASTCFGVQASYTKNFKLDEVHGVDLDGGDPYNSVTEAGAVRFESSFDINVGKVSALRSGCVSVADIDARNSSGRWNSVDSMSSSGFGPGWYNCFDVQINNITTRNSTYRGGKIQATIDAQINNIISDRAGFVDFGFTFSSRAQIGQMTLGKPNDPEPWPVTSLTGSGTIATITFTNPVPLQNSQQVVISGVTSPTGLNGTFVATKISNTVFTYANTTSGTASGTIIGKWPDSVKPTFWVADSNNEVLVNSIYFVGNSNNTAGDVHTGSSDKVLIQDIFTQNAFSLTYSGSAGSSAISSSRLISRVNGIRLFEAQTQFPDGTASAPSITNSGDLFTGIYWPTANAIAATTSGSKRFEINANGCVGIPSAVEGSTFYISSSGRHPAQIWTDNDYYTYFGSLAATNGKAGFSFVTKNTSGTDIYTFTISDGSTNSFNFQGPHLGTISFGKGSSASGGTLVEQLKINNSGTVRFIPLASAPATGNSAGDVYFDSTFGKLRVYSGTAWANVTTS